MKRILEQLYAHTRFLVLSHVSPDGDTIGSAVALCLALEKLGKDVVCAVDGDIPEKLGFLTGYFPVHSFADTPKEGYDCIIAVDAGDLGRLGKFGTLFEAMGETIVIDHHGTNTGYGKYNLIRPYGATGQIILELLEVMGAKIDENMANALYAAISTDTGNFSYSNVDAALLHAAARLREQGADIPMLTERIYHVRSLGATKLLGQALERLQLHCGGRIASLYVLQADYAACGAVKEDCDELINYAREVEGVEIAIFLRETGEKTFKVSLRSKVYADVAKLAMQFQGGGHVHAAGCTAQGSLEEALGTLLRAAEALL